MLEAVNQQPLFTQDSSVALSDFLSGVAQVVKAHSRKIWVRAEISKIKDNGHLYLELVEHDDAGREVAKCPGRIWASVKPGLLAKFAGGTGANLEAGIKVLLLAEASFHPQYGFAAMISDIDPAYTLGDMERKLIEIRRQLLADKIHGLNRLLPTPLDFTRVAVISPENAAGLGDFRSHADQLAAAGLCQFDYFAATFQGTSAAGSIYQMLRKVAGIDRAAGSAGYDAVVIIRGGGAVTDLAWLNDYQLAQAVCRIEIPVFTGIGHQQDNTILDELANTRFDTPSKVINYISNQILGRAKDALQDWQAIVGESHRILAMTQHKMALAHDYLVSQMLGKVASVRQCVETEMSVICLKAGESLSTAGVEIQSAISAIDVQAQSTVRAVAQSQEGLMREIAAGIQGRHQLARQEAEGFYREITFHAVSACQQASSNLYGVLAEIGTDARHGIDRVRREMEFSMSEILGLGPARTLERGYALVKMQGADGRAHVVSSAKAARAAADLILEFHDGELTVIPKEST